MRKLRSSLKVRELMMEFCGDKTFKGEEIDISLGADRADGNSRPGAWVHCPLRQALPAVHTSWIIFTSLHSNQPSILNSSFEVCNNIKNESDHFPAICIVKNGLCPYVLGNFSALFGWCCLNSWWGEVTPQIQDACHGRSNSGHRGFFKSQNQCFNNQ